MPMAKFIIANIRKKIENTVIRSIRFVAVCRLKRNNETQIESSLINEKWWKDFQYIAVELMGWNLPVQIENVSKDL